MKKLSVKIMNCFGIGQFNFLFEFDKNKTIMIYAPNGTMKTSFAKTFSCIAENDPKNKPCDKVYPDRKTEVDIQADGRTIIPDDIFVVDAEDTNFDSSKKITSFLASKELKKEYDSIYQELDNGLVDFLKKLKNISKSTDCKSELINTFSEENENSSVFEILCALKPYISGKKYAEYNFRYNDIFDLKGKVKAFIAQYHIDIEQYFKKYNDILNQSSVFKIGASGKTFGTYNASELMKCIEDDAFFDAGHRITLNNTQSISSTAELKDIIQKEIERIVSDAALKNIFDKIDKAIGSNVELRAFKDAISKDNLLLTKLRDYANFKKEVWYSYFSKISSDYEAIIDLYTSKKDPLNEVFQKADAQQTKWENIISLFNHRFHVPFIVEIKNQRDLILKQETAALAFKYDDRTGTPIEKEKNDLLQILSRGERRAFCILQILFEIEARKLREDNLLIFDDISDSFDYKNKYAIIEYLQEVSHMGNFEIILLTHNFDFYRTVASRFSLDRKKNCFMANKCCETREIKLFDGEYTKDVLSVWLVAPDEKKIISIIPFTRNIIQYTTGDQSDDYKKLTSSLHKKSTSDSFLLSDLIAIFTKIYTSQAARINLFSSSEKVTEYILRIADSIRDEHALSEVFLENKIVLAIAIRLKAEIFMLSKLPGINTDAMKSNQTRELFKHFEQSPAKTKEAIDILRRVNLMTPEHIHVNAFMYEPLIDMSVIELRELYKDTSRLA